MIEKLLKWAKDRRAGTAIEYGMLVAFISVALMSIIFMFGDDLNTIFGKISVYLAKNIN